LRAYAEAYLKDKTNAPDLDIKDGVLPRFYGHIHKEA